MSHRLPAVIAASLLFGLVVACATRSGPATAVRAGAPPEAGQVEVIRTAYGVPHIYADTFRALGYALGYLQLEDYGDRVPLTLLGARGELARYHGITAVDADVSARPYYLRAVETYALIDRETRDVYEGFAAGVNRYIDRHPQEFAAWMPADFSGYDVAASYVYRSSQAAITRWQRRLAGTAESPGDTPSPTDAPAPDFDRVGSSAWALAPSRTTSGAPILLRNPHLSWNAGYWEAHVVVPGRLDFYGDFRIGGPIGIVGGFNADLAFATTNNEVSTTEVYALEADPQRPDHYLFDGGRVPIRREVIAVSYRNGDGQATVTRERLATHIGPVLYRDGRTIYVIRAAEDGAYRGGDQFLRMMQARNLRQWMNAMRLRAHPFSNFVYADAAGNIFYLWNGAVPVRPHPAGGAKPVAANRQADIWTELHEIDELPQLLNPPSGYVRNDNDPPWLVNVRQPLAPAAFPPYFQPPAPLDLRTQHSALLIGGDTRLSLEDVVRLKHTPRMLLADRVKADLLAAVRAALASGTVRGDDVHAVAEAASLLERWDNTAAADSEGAVLFAGWWRLYEDAVGDAAFAEPWRADAAFATPRGLAQPELAAARFADAVRDTAMRFGSPDVPWGDVHRIRRGRVDEPASGCPAALGCFRVLTYGATEDGRRAAVGGDGWVLAVELTRPPRAFSVLSYGQSAKPGAPHHDDQAGLFARGEMKRVAYTRQDVERAAARRYRPGLEDLAGDLYK